MLDRFRMFLTWSHEQAHHRRRVLWFPASLRRPAFARRSARRAHFRQPHQAPKFGDCCTGEIAFEYFSNGFSLRLTEHWLSGLKRTIANRVKVSHIFRGFESLMLYAFEFFKLDDSILINYHADSCERARRHSELHRKTTALASWK
jgi:hypothetical protein